MNLENVNPLEYPAWDELLLEHSKSTFFYSTHWAKVLNETYGYRPLYFVEIKKGYLQLLIPVMEIKSWLTGRRGCSLPFTDCCEPIVTHESDFNNAWKVLVGHGEKVGWKYLEIRGGREFYQTVQSSLSFYEHSLRLSSEPKGVYKRFRDSHKRNIKKAQKVGVEVSLSESYDSMKEFYRLNCMTRRRHGLPPQPFTFFKNIYNYIISKQHGMLAIARYQGETIASAIFFHFNRKAIYKFGASNMMFQHFRANNLIMWKALEWYCLNGYRAFSLGRTDIGHDGLRKFKLGWGTDEERINYYRYNIKNKEFVTCKSKVTGTHNLFMRNAPPGILRLIGKVLYQHVG